MEIMVFNEEECKVRLSKEECILLQEVSNDILEENNEVLNYDEKCVLLNDTIESIKFRLVRQQPKNKLIRSMIRDLNTQFKELNNDSLLFEDMVEHLKDGDRVRIQLGDMNIYDFENYCRYGGELNPKWDRKHLNAKVKFFKNVNGKLDLSFESEKVFGSDGYFQVIFRSVTSFGGGYRGNNVFYREYKDYVNFAKVVKWIC
jgi:hypothetical protein